MTDRIEPVLAFAGRKRNEDLILALRDLKWLDSESRTLDPTYGKGRFWKLWQPDDLVRTDIVPRLSLDTPARKGLDATKLHETFGREFDVVVIDGPYKLNGTPSAGGPADSDEDYGVHVPARWQDRYKLMEDMMRSGAQVLKDKQRGKRKPRLLFKCQDQVVSGQKRFQSVDFAVLGRELGFRLADALYVEGYREQPVGRTQKHAQQDFSVMLVFEKV